MVIGTEAIRVMNERYAARSSHLVVELTFGENQVEIWLSPVRLLRIEFHSVDSLQRKGCESFHKR